MTDSESDLSNPNVFTFSNANTTVSARGPNTNVTNFSFRNHQLASSMYMSRNFERPRYAESVSDQRSIYYRRETSPMSIHSACDIRPRNFQQYYNGMGSHQSVFNGRGGSPVSMRSIDSSASVSAADIAFAFKNVKFNKYDLRVIKEAYNKLMKQRFRKRIEKRRNMRMFLKGSRHRSGDDSGEQGSDSSISSDDCRSVKTSYKENMSCTGSARMNLSEFRKTVRDNNMFKDYADNLKQNNFKNMFTINSSNRNQTVNNSKISKQNHAAPTLRDRFKNGFVLPSQRFNRSVASTAIPESSERHHKNTEANHRKNETNCASNKQLQNQKFESGSEEEIFSGTSIRERETHSKPKEASNKRRLDSDDELSLPDKKKSKISSPVKNAQSHKNLLSKAKNSNANNNNDNDSNNFEFAKPTLPVRKSKTKVQEKVIAKSKQPLTGFVEHIPNQLVTNIAPEPPVVAQEKAIDNQKQDETFETTQNSDVSMRPSFIKRKLFTQKLDVAEKANLSSDALNSPQSNGYSGLQKEKNKARKLVTSQSCLNRDVQEDNNLLDLIRKILPPDRMNVTNQTTMNQTKSDVNNSNKNDDDDKWDVTSVISMCNENDVSDTFTDEEIFSNDIRIKDAKRSNKENPIKVPKTNTSANIKQTVAKSCEQPRECRILVENVDYSPVCQKPAQNRNTNLSNTDLSKTVAKSSAKTFWDTDFESDAECQVTVQKNFEKENQSKANAAAVVESSSQVFKQPLVPPTQSPVPKHQLQVPETSRWLSSAKNNTTMNNTLDSTTRKLNASSISIRSHRTTTKKKCCYETCFQEITSAKRVVKDKTTSKPETKAPNKPKPETTVKNMPKPESETKTASKPKTKSKTEKPESKNKGASKPEAKNKTTSKAAEIKNKTTSKTETNSAKTIANSPNESNKKTVAKSTKKTLTKSKTPTKSTKSKSNTRNADKSRSTSLTPLKPKETPSKPRHQVKKSSKNISNYQSPRDRPMRSCRTPSQNRSMENSRSSRQFDITPLNIAANRPGRKKNIVNDTSLQELSQTDITCRALKSKTRGTSNDSAALKITDAKNTKTEVQNKLLTKKAKPSPNKSMSYTLRKPKSPQLKAKSKTIKQIQKNITNYLTPKCDRPIRSCRTPGQNRSIENYKSSIRGR